MITPNRVANAITAEPFRPFRVTTTDGRAYDVRHPEMPQVGRSTVTLFLSMSDDEADVKQGTVRIPLSLIESVEPLDAARPQGTS